jgi:putative nucleotidyltransferase with HDIG domain
MFLFPKGAGFADNGIFDFFESRVEDPPGPKIILILAGDRSLDSVQNWPFPRRIHAQLLGQLERASLIVMDILFLEKTDPQEDKTLSETIQGLGNVILASATLPGPDGGLQILNPIPELFDSAYAVGIANVRSDTDGISRDYPLVFPTEGAFAPSLVLSILISLSYSQGNITPSPFGWNLETSGGDFGLLPDFTYKLHHPKYEMPVYEYSDVLRGLVSEDVFDGAIVFVGVNAAGATDSFSIGGGKSIPGSLYLAHATSTVFMGFSPIPLSSLFVVLISAFLSFLGAKLGFWYAESERGFTLFKKRILPFKFNLALIVLMFILVAWVVITWVLFSSFERWIPPLLPVLVMLVCFVLVTLIRVRFLSADWEIQKLSIDSLLFLGRLDLAAVSRSFEEHLLKQWPEIERLTGVALLNPHAPAKDPEVLAALGHIPPPKKLADPSLEASIVRGSGGLNRLLLGLPDIEGRVDQYAILGWVGDKSQEMLRSLAALVLSSAMHFKAIEEYRTRQELFVGMLRLIMGAVDAKDPTTAGHSTRVAELSRELAQNMGLSPAEIEDIYIGGLLHDVGKLGIPDVILNKPGKLDDDEFMIMRKHPTIGTDIMRSIKLPEGVYRAISEHHERLDGLGYPMKLTADKISLHGKILKIADVFDALASRRQYKDPFPLDKVYKILKDGCGTEFDETLVNLVLAKPFCGPGVEDGCAITLEKKPEEQSEAIPQGAKAQPGNGQGNGARRQA